MWVLQFLMLIYVWYNNINVVADAAVGGGGAGAFSQLTVDKVRTQGDKKSQTEVQSLTRHIYSSWKVFQTIKPNA